MQSPSKWIRDTNRDQKIHDTLFELYDVFTDEALEYFYNFYRYGDEWTFVTPFTRLFRNLSCDSTSDFYTGKLELEKYLSQVIGRDLKIRVAKLFFDTVSYQTSPHFDHPNITAMVQIYFKSPNPLCPGTLFFEPEIHLIRYQENCGYVNLNHDLKVHQSNQLSKDYRCSLALQLV